MTAAACAQAISDRAALSAIEALLEQARTAWGSRALSGEMCDRVEGRFVLVQGVGGKMPISFEDALCILRSACETARKGE